MKLMKHLLLKILNLFLKVFKIKLIKVSDQFDNVSISVGT